LREGGTRSLRSSVSILPTGGGKTHSLIALTHTAGGMKGVATPAEFLDPDLLPKGKSALRPSTEKTPIRPTGGRWEMAFSRTPHGGKSPTHSRAKSGYERVRKSDESHTAPGAETLAELFGGEPSLILLDELSVYLRKVANLPGTRDQLSAFLTSLFKAVESSPRVALVYTLAIGKDGRAGDAYSAENQYIADRMAEVESISARKATLLNPTEDHETVQVLLRRLFKSVDTNRSVPVVEAYRTFGSITERLCRLRSIGRMLRLLFWLATRSIRISWRR